MVDVFNRVCQLVKDNQFYNPTWNGGDKAFRVQLTAQAVVGVFQLTGIVLTPKGTVQEPFHPPGMTDAIAMTARAQSNIFAKQAFVEPYLREAKAHLATFLSMESILLDIIRHQHADDAIYMSVRNIVTPHAMAAELIRNKEADTPQLSRRRPRHSAPVLQTAPLYQNTERVAELDSALSESESAAQIMVTLKESPSSSNTVSIYDVEHPPKRQCTNAFPSTSGTLVTLETCFGDIALSFDKVQLNRAIEGCMLLVTRCQDRLKQVEILEAEGRAKALAEAQARSLATQALINKARGRLFALEKQKEKDDEEMRTLA